MVESFSMQGDYEVDRCTHICEQLRAGGGGGASAAPAPCKLRPRDKVNSGHMSEFSDAHGRCVPYFVRFTGPPP